MSSTDRIVIAGAARTPLGSFQGKLKSVPATVLGSIAIRAALDRSALKDEFPDEVLMGCVLPAALGQAPARQASIRAGIPQSTGCTTINKVCGSGMKAAMLGHDAILAGTAKIVVAGGMESMSNAPYLLPKARGGYRMGHGEIYDHMFLDGLQNAYDGALMGKFAEDTAEKYQLTRAVQDEFALTSLGRAREATERGIFAREIATMKVDAETIAADEQPLRADPEKIPKLKAAFREGGTVTAANSSSISDGAAALVLMRENEAFAVVTLAAMRDLALPHEKVNVHGGACALGHPIGASGARIIVTLLNALETRGLKRGVASLCIGGGEATAMAVERVV